MLMFIGDAPFFGVLVRRIADACLVTIKSNASHAMRDKDPHREPLTEVLSPKLVRSMLGVSASTLHRLVRSKAFPKAIPISPGRIGWRRETVERWLAEREAKADE